MRDAIVDVAIGVVLGIMLCASLAVLAVVVLAEASS